MLRDERSWLKKTSTFSLTISVEGINDIKSYNDKLVPCPNIFLNNYLENAIYYKARCQFKNLNIVNYRLRFS